MKLKVLISMLVIIASLFYTMPANAENLAAAGSTFSGNFMDKCRTEYAKAGKGTILYTPNGSGAGRNFFNNKLVDFAVSDTPYGPNDSKPKEEFLYVPLVSGPVAVVYNLPNYKVRLKLSKDVLAKIFSGQIKMWNDPEIAKINPGKLPNLRITVVYRADGSGTSEVFTSYLNSVVPTIWNKPGSKNFTNAFPGNINDFAGFFQSASGSTQIAFLQSKTLGSIAYNEVSYVRGMQSALIENESNHFVAPTTNAAASFLSGLKFNQDGSAILNYKNTATASYNISTFAYAIVWKNNGTKSSDIKDFLNFALDKCINIDGYASIKGAALKVAKSQVAKIN